MRVLEITGEPILHGGQERFIYNLLSHYEEPQITIDVLTPYYSDNNSFVGLVADRGGSFYELGCPFEPGKSRRFLLNAVGAFLKEHDYDVVHIHSGSTSALAYMSKAANNCHIRKIIVHSHCESEPSLKHSLVRLAFGGEIKRNATDFWACSNVAGEDKYPPSIRKKMVLISNGIDIDEFARCDELRKKYRQIHGIPDDAFVVGTVGRFSYQKNTEYLVEVFDAVRNRIDNAVLVLIGDGELRGELEKQIRRLGIENRVIMTGNVDNVSDHLQMLDVFALPSRFEGLPFVALEAQAAGLPSIISDGITSEVVIGDNVTVLSLDDQKQWIDKLIDLQGEPLADNKNKLVEAGYSITETVKRIEELYLA